MDREQYICLGHKNRGNVINLRNFYNKLGGKADELINLHNKVECKPAVNEAFRIYKLMNKINRMFKYQTHKNIWE
ncbi:hypothetical protein [Anaeromicrobium sediminis]|uniref:Uncharacterized protein n=1 Tax=Anaeromicrobium sediminis TaxID=1478221 RepID=A0A267MQV2_9FIRM|nr:hypothetical protein [Anaeromicrobium sediminis]PAB61288.1 hypothetical protein CCE28_02330 [Anaeromicrobium sediminis]